MMDYRRIVDTMDLETLCGQVLAYDIQPGDSYEETERIIRRIRPGGLFLHQKSKTNRGKLNEQQEVELSKLAEELSGIPCVMLTDVENGPGSYDATFPFLPAPMAWGACDDEALIERAGELTAQFCRSHNIQYTLSPLVDMNREFRENTVCTLSVSSDRDRVIRIAGAYLRGLQKNGYLAGCVKHFPGGGMDERNPHFVTTVNPMSKEKWMDSYGVIYKEMFRQGTASVMPGHISCPAFQRNDYDVCENALPATVSKELLTDLLRNELGFDGCIISDAMSMIGACAVVEEGKLSVEFLKAGGDFILFPEPEEHQRLMDAVRSGELPLERLKDAAIRVLKLKEQCRLFENEQVEAEIGDTAAIIQELEVIANEIADRAVKVVRDIPSLIPVKKKQGKVYIIQMGDQFDYSELEDEFRIHGWQVNSQYAPSHAATKKVIPEYDMVLVVAHAGRNGGSLRFGWKESMPLWRGYAMQHPCVIFCGLDDPYKLFDFPFAKTYLNTFGDTPSQQRALVRVILGTVAPTAKNPVSFKGVFEIEE